MASASKTSMPLATSTTRHRSFDDQQVVLPQLVAARLLPADNCASAVGTINPDRSIDLQRRYLRAYFDAALKQAGTDLSAAIRELPYPETLTDP